MKMLGKIVRGDQVNLYVVTDVHYGAEACARDRFAAFVGRIASDRSAVWIGLGDYIEAIAPDDRRFDAGGLDARMRATEISDLFSWQVDGLLEVLAPVRSRCIALLRGNHEAVAMRRTRTGAWWRRLTESLGVADCGTSCMLDLVVGGRTVRVAAHHGAGGAATDGGRAQRLARFADTWVADLVLVGHMHAKAELTRVRLAGDRECRKAVAVRTRALCCGAWYRSYHTCGSYAEDRGLPPGEIGAPIITLSRSGVERVDWITE